MNTSERRETFVDCDCGCKKLVISVWKINAQIEDIILSMWTLASRSTRLSLWEAITFSCRAIFKRRVHEDCMLLSQEEAHRLGKWLIELSGEGKEE